MKKVNLYLLLFLSLILMFKSYDVNAQQRGQAQQQPEEQIPVQLKPKRLELLNKIANNTIQNEFPFRKREEIDILIEELIREREIADTNLVNRNIKQVYRNIPASFEPTQSFKKINLAYGYSTTIVFLDNNGEPWDIFDYNVGDDNIFDINFRQKHILTLTPKRHSGQTNITLMFQNGKMPISFNLGINNDVVDYITQININGYGNHSPEERTVLFNRGASSGADLSYLARFDEDYLAQIITNTIPDGFVEKDAYLNGDLLSKREFRIFEKDAFLYVRTRHEYHSPSPVSQRNSADGETKVFKLPYLSAPMFVINGKVETLSIR